MTFGLRARFPTLLLVLTVLASGRALAQHPLTGRWELTSVKSVLGNASSADTRFTLFITRARADSLFGRALIYPNRDEPPVNWFCGELRGAAVRGDRLRLVILTTDAPESDALLEAGVRHDSMFVADLRFRSGERVLPFGIGAVFVRVSTDTTLPCALRFDPPPKPGLGGRFDTTTRLPEDTIVFDAQVEIPPEQISCPAVRYPQSLRLAAVQGRVVVQFVLDTLGSAMPTTLNVLESPHDSLTLAAREMVVGCRFSPGRVKGRAVKVLVALPVDFSLRARRDSTSRP